MRHTRFLVSMLAFSAFLAGCDTEEPAAPKLDVDDAAFATFPPAAVAMIGGATLNTNFYCGFSGTYANVMGRTAGGCLPVAGHAALTGFSFTALLPSAVTAGTLGGYDIAILNMATTTVACNAANVPAAARSEIIAFAGAGKKVIIFDSECSVGGTGLDYSWLPYPFTTANPGALGAQGTLTIVEENTLSTNAAGSYFINAGILGAQTDAVGDMNVMTTLDPAWCVDMSGTNAINVTGPVHVYANYPVGTDIGLFIYNGLDVDYLGFNGGAGSSELLKVWVNELLQPVDPSGLPCRLPVVGITLDPDDATNNVGEDHTVTATVADLLGAPQSGITVDFEVLSGPNAGDMGSATTDANGEATFTYTGDGGVGDDAIEACFTDAQGTEKCSSLVNKTWVNVPPTCGLVTVAPSLAAVNTDVYASGSFDDVGDPFDHTAEWDWGDLTTSAGTVNQAAHTVGPDGHMYPDAGIYTVGLTVTDNAGASCNAQFQYVVVYDPGAGFVTGGGWIDSPAGAYADDVSMTGKANFGFVSKYKKGATTPDGNTEFQFHAADMNFHSAAYDWLVVTGSDYARFKGTGTINGDLAPNGELYKFMIWAGDDDPDTFRIKIWYEVVGVETVVYDNGMDQAIAGGSIVIHTKK